MRVRNGTVYIGPAALAHCASDEILRQFYGARIDRANVSLGPPSNFCSVMNKAVFDKVVEEDRKPCQLIVADVQ